MKSRVWTVIFLWSIAAHIDHKVQWPCQRHDFHSCHSSHQTGTKICSQIPGSRCARAFVSTSSLITAISWIQKKVYHALTRMRLINWPISRSPLIIMWLIVLATSSWLFSEGPAKEEASWTSSVKYFEFSKWIGLAIYKQWYKRRMNVIQTLRISRQKN